MILTRTATILYAEDDDDDAFMLSRALGRLGVDHAVKRVSDGQEAVMYLTHEPRPDLVVLDLKLPKLGGFDVLATIRARTELKDLPVVILTGSTLSKDLQMADELGVTSYFEKSYDWDGIAEGLKLTLERILRQ